MYPPPPGFIIMEPGRDIMSPYLAGQNIIISSFWCCKVEYSTPKESCSSGFQQYESVPPPDALRVLDHLAQHLVVHVDLGVDVELVVLQEAALLGVSLPHLNTKLE